jgi:hypothetical protein
MKKLSVTFEGTYDPTGYLFTFIKSLSAALRCSRYAAYADDIVSTSGFAFRIWVNPVLCPSATSMWEFRKQQPWVASGGLNCDYIERMWGEDAIEEERRFSAVAMIKRSVDDGVAAVAWDISGCEWGLLIGYDDEKQEFAILKTNFKEDVLPYEKLGKIDIPILSALAVTGENGRDAGQIAADTLKIAASHLRGEEWAENPKGLAAYDTLISAIETQNAADAAWNIEYYLGMLASLRWYAWKYLEKSGFTRLAELYKTSHESLLAAFGLVTAAAKGDADAKAKIIAFVGAARDAEAAALAVMEAL